MPNPFTTRPKAAPYSERRSITASAARINLRNQRDVELARNNATQAAWQDAAWANLDAIGEIKFAFGLVASVLSRVRLYAGAVVDPESPPVPVAQAVKAPDTVNDDESDDDAYRARQSSGIDAALAKDAKDLLAKSFSRSDIPSMARMFALNISVPGECYLVHYKGAWSIRSTSEMRVDTAGRIQLKEMSAGETRAPVILPLNTPIGRIWRQHPRYSKDADSSMRALEADCQELLLLGQMIRSNARAALNAGMVFVPDEVSVSARPRPESPDADSDEAENVDAFEQELITLITEPITSETSGNSAVPLVLRGPGEFSEKIRHILFERKSDEFLIGRADRALDRILQGLDVPKDIVTGLANVKYSNAVQIDESLYKAHVEPLALMFVDAITEIVLRPQLSAKGYSDEDVARVVVWYDPSEIVTRPNRSEDAEKGYSNYLLSGKAWRDAHGFSDTDAPDEEEIARRIAIEKASVPEDVANALFQTLLPRVLGAARESNIARSGGLPDELASMLGEGGAEQQRVEPTSIEEDSVP